jgi:hypothetical protein
VVEVRELTCSTIVWNGIPGDLTSLTMSIQAETKGDPPRKREAAPLSGDEDMFRRHEYATEVRSPIGVKSPSGDLRAPSTLINDLIPESFLQTQSRPKPLFFPL